MAEYTSVNRALLQVAFGIAHQASERNLPKQYRDKFRQIARLLWQAHGELGNDPPPGAGERLLEVVETVGDPQETLNVPPEAVSPKHKGKGK